MARGFNHGAALPHFEHLPTAHQLAACFPHANTMTTLSFLPDSAIVALYGRLGSPPPTPGPSAIPNLSAAQPAWSALLRSRFHSPAAAAVDFPCASATAQAEGAAMRRGLLALGPPPTVYQPQEQKPLGEVLRNAGKRALGGGIPGAAAMGIQVGGKGPARSAAAHLRQPPRKAAQALCTA